MSIPTKKNSILGSLAGMVVSVFARKSIKPTINDLEKMEFKASTQRLGVRFTERIRKIFRRRWIKKV